MSGGTGYKWRSCSTEWLLGRGAWLAVGLIERQQLNISLQIIIIVCDLNAKIASMDSAK